jgi:hypothetical protein
MDEVRSDPKFDGPRNDCGLVSRSFEALAIWLILSAANFSREEAATPSILSAKEGGELCLPFSLSQSDPSLRFNLVFGACLDTRSLDGAEKSEYTFGLGLGVAFEEDEPLSVLEYRDPLALL